MKFPLEGATAGMLRLLCFCFCAVCFVPSAGSQTAAEGASLPLPAYDVVVIRPNNTGRNGSDIGVDDGFFRGTNVSLKRLLVKAYGIREGLIAGIPAWADSPRYDISAKVVDADPNVLAKLDQRQRRAMLTAVLVERFHLKVHFEDKTVPVYDMIIGRDGPKFRESPPPPPVDPSKPPLAFGPGSMSVDNTDLKANRVPLSELADNLSIKLDRTVIDKTGLTGRYDLRLRWTSDRDALANGDNAQPDAPPTIFTAIEEQLGLRLVSSRGAVPTLVVDHADPPSAN